MLAFFATSLIMSLKLELEGIVTDISTGTVIVSRSSSVISKITPVRLGNEVLKNSPYLNQVYVSFMGSELEVCTPYTLNLTEELFILDFQF